MSKEISVASVAPVAPVVMPKDLTPLKPQHIIDREAMEENLRVLRDKDRKMVRGKFVYHETPGGSVGFNFRKHKGDEIQSYMMKDGSVYEVPMAVAKHLNTECSYPTYTFKNDEAGRPVVTASERVRRMSFQSLEFLD